MSLFADAEKLVGQGTEGPVGQDVTQQGEQLLENETGGKSGSEISEAGSALDRQGRQGTARPVAVLVTSPRGHGETCHGKLVPDDDGRAADLG